MPENLRLHQRQQTDPLLVQLATDRPRQERHPQIRRHHLADEIPLRALERDLRLKSGAHAVIDDPVVQQEILLKQDELLRRQLRQRHFPPVRQTVRRVEHQLQLVLHERKPLKDLLLHRQQRDADFQPAGGHIVLHLFRAVLPQMDFDPGINFVELAHDARKKIGADHRRQTDVDLPFLQLHHVGQVSRQAPHRSHDVLRLKQDGLSGVGQLDAFAQPLEQLDLQLVLQIFDHPADRRLGDKQVLGGFRKTFGPGDLQKILQIPDLHPLSTPS